LLRTGATGTAEGQTYSFAADAASRITVSGASVVATMSEIADQGAVLQLCREASTQGVVAIMVDAALAPLSAADLNGVTVDEVICRASSGPWVRHTLSITFTATTAIFYEGGVENARAPLADLMGAGSNLFLAELGTLRLKAYRRPGGQIVIVLTQSGGTNAPPNREPAAVYLGIQRPYRQSVRGGAECWPVFRCATLPWRRRSGCAPGTRVPAPRGGAARAPQCARPPAPPPAPVRRRQASGRLAK
jgi:hypothetical protein